MKKRAFAAGAALLLACLPASAHRLDEYLQAVTIAVEKDRIQAQMHLTPGVAVFPTVFAGMDTDKDKALSLAEQRAYAERVLGDLSLTVNNKRLPLHIASCTFPKTSAMKEGRGDIQIAFTAQVPRSSGHNRKLVWENHHRSQISVYLVNGLVPNDPQVRVTAQTRNYEQSVYQMDYVQDGADSAPFPAWRPSTWMWAGTMGLLLLTQFAFLSWQLAKAARARNDKDHRMLRPGSHSGEKKVKS